MRITTSQLRRIIKEEARRSLREAVAPSVSRQIEAMVKRGEVPPAKMLAQAMHELEHPSVEMYLPAAEILVDALESDLPPDGQALEDALEGRANDVSMVVSAAFNMLGLQRRR